jgi:Tol biopolymer transport system component
MMDPIVSLNASLSGHYRVERELGAGGMAIVYLAHDVKHDRSVAIKVLREDLSASLAKERFLREITIAAGLTHPHILPLLDSGALEGTLFYVMPFVEGESLRGRLTREHQLPLDDALQITREVADALAYAHAHDVAHRDIKPENILLSSGHALVADFGIARAITAAGSARLTATGLALGTPAYMSPEQAAGTTDLDGRSDLYSLGCVLYEMLAGEPPFTGPTPQAVLAKRLSTPAPRVSILRDTVPAAVEQALEKALARTPADRFATLEKFGAALAQTEAMHAPSGGRTPIDARLPGALRRSPRSAKLVGAAVALAAVALVANQLLKPEPLDVTVSEITPVTSGVGVAFQPSISPDGNEVAYVAGPIGLPRLFVRSTVNAAGGAAVHLGDTAPGGEWLPRWSSGGQSVRFLSCPGTAGFDGPGCEWRETGKLGGAVLAVTVPRGAQQSWSPDGARVAFVRGDTILTASAIDTVARRVAIDSAEAADIHSLTWSPDGKQIAYVDGNAKWLTSGNVEQASIWIVDSDGGVPRLVAAGDHLNISPAWLDARHLLFVSDVHGARGVYVVEVGKNGSRGMPRAIPGAADPHSISYSISSRRLAFAKFTIRQNIWAYPLDRSGPVSIRDGRPVTTGNHEIELHDVSPDDRWIVYDDKLRGQMDIFKVPAGGGDVVPLTDSPSDEEDPRWSPDGREIAFWTAFRLGSMSITVMPAAGGAPLNVIGSGGNATWPNWSPSGLDISFNSNRTRELTTWIVSRDRVGSPWHAPVQLTFFCNNPRWAPDGSGMLCWTGDGLALYSREGRILWRRDFEAPNRLTSPSWEGYPRAYSRDGRTLYLTATHEDGRSGIWAVPVAGGTPRLVVAFDDPAIPSRGFLSVGRDYLYLTVSQYESNIWVANLHW